MVHLPRRVQQLADVLHRLGFGVDPGCAPHHVQRQRHRDPAPLVLRHLAVPPAGELVHSVANVRGVVVWIGAPSAVFRGVLGVVLMAFVNLLGVKELLHLLY